MYTSLLIIILTPTLSLHLLLSSLPYINLYTHTQYTPIHIYALVHIYSYPTICIRLLNTLTLPKESDTVKEGIISLFTTLWFTPSTSTSNSTTYHTTSSTSSVKQLPQVPVSATTTISTTSTNTNTTTSEAITNAISSSASKVGSSSSVTPRRLTRGRAGAGGDEVEADTGMRYKYTIYYIQ